MLNQMVGDKKEKCWRTFCEKLGYRDSWRLRTSMSNLRDLDGTTLVMDQQKSNGLVRNHFVWNDEMREDDTLDSAGYD